MQKTSTMLAEKAEDGTRSAERLARQLIRHLGIAGAIRTCHENHWNGVLAVIEAEAAQPGAIAIPIAAS